MRGSGGMGSGRVGFVPEGKVGREFEWVNRDDLTGIRHLGDSSGYDRIVMNPPFSNNLDIQHVRHAYDLLRPGGRIVAIVGEGAFTRSGKTETEFRAWMDALGAEVEELPANTFKSSELLSKTGANARMVVIDKPAGDGVVASTAANAVPMEDWLSVRVLTEVAGEAFKKLGHYPTLKILDTPEDAGVATGDRTFSGFVRNQIIHLVRNGIASRDEAIDTVWHELFHYGLRRFMTREQYIADMNKLYGRDAFLKLKADAWIKNDPVAKKLRDAGESEDYIKARGADEALAWFAESIRGNQEFRNSGLKGKAIRTITRWLAEIADFFGANRVASQIRAYTNEEARRYVMSVFGKFNDDSVEVLAWDGDKPTFMTAGNDRDRSREESLKRNADEIRAMDPDVRDDTEFQSFPGGYQHDISMGHQTT